MEDFGDILIDTTIAATAEKERYEKMVKQTLPWGLRVLCSPQDQFISVVIWRLYRL